MPYTRTDEDEDWINEAATMTERRNRAQIVSRKGRVTVEVPPYAAVSVPEWAPRWGEGAPPVDTVLTWTPVDDPCAYVAICVGDDEWRTSDPNGRSTITFAQVARLIANNPCSVAVDWRDIPTVEARPRGRDAVKNWASQFLAEREVAKINGDAGTPVGEGH